MGFDPKTVFSLRRLAAVVSATPHLSGPPSLSGGITEVTVSDITATTASRLRNGSNLMMQLAGFLCLSFGRAGG